MDDALSPRDLAERAVRADLKSARFRAGAARGHWRVLSDAFPVLIFAVAALKPDGTANEHSFRFELKSYSGIAPDVRLWDNAKNLPLATELRPKGSPIVEL